MERHFNDRNFEKLLRDNASQYRMYPSDKVWKNIHSTLHTRRKWYGVSALAFLLITGVLISSLVINNSTDKTKITEAKTSVPVANTTTLQLGLLNEKNNSPQILSTEKTLKFAQKTIQSINKAVLSSSPIVQGSFIPETTNDVAINDIQSAEMEDKTSELANNNRDEEDTQTLQSNADDNSTQEVKSEKITDEVSATKLASTEIIDEINALASQNIPIVVSKRHPKFTAQLYLTPTISYRKLSENKRSSGVLYSYNQFVDLNNLVKHKPAMGLEFGVEGKYRINNSFFVKSGLQFNINRYDIRAYSHPTEIATVAINTGPRTDYMATLSNYRNFNGTNPNWLENFYFQAAIPVGAEIILGERKDISWGISGTIQPTYVIGDKAYLISSDYKNYAKFPDLMRRWNLSSGLETFVSFSTGKIDWQTGPHLRYQHLSSFVSGYPVKENLFAVGLKVAATISKKK